MKEIFCTIIIAITTLLISGCFDSRKYNEEADKECEMRLSNGTKNINELLLYALKSDASPSTIKKILRMGASPNATVGKGKIPIICYAKSPNALKVMYYANPLNQKKDGKFLFIEHAFGHLPLFYCQSPELCDAYMDLVLDNCTPAYSVDDGNLTIYTREKVENILRNLKDERNRSPLFYARNNVMVDYWLAKGNNINAENSSGENVLMQFIRQDDTCTVEMLGYLILRGADVNFGLGKGVATPLGIALQLNRSREILDFLISRGAKLENVNSASNLFYYVQNPKQVDFLKSKNLSPNIVSKNGIYVGGTKYVARTPLARAIGDKKPMELIESLIDAGAKVEDAFFELNGKQVSLLEFSILKLNDNELTEFLLKHGGKKVYNTDGIFNALIDEDDIGNISASTFEFILKNTSSLKDRSYAKKVFTKLLAREGVSVEALDTFLTNCPVITSDIIRDTIIDIFERNIGFGANVPENIILVLIDHTDDLNNKVNGKTMIAYALEYKDVSVDIIKAISKKMYFPFVNTGYKYEENVDPIDIAKKMDKKDIAAFLEGNFLTFLERKSKILVFDENNKPAIYGIISLGIKKSDFEKFVKNFPEEGHLRIGEEIIMGDSMPLIYPKYIRVWVNNGISGYRVHFDEHERLDAFKLELGIDEGKIKDIAVKAGGNGEKEIKRYPYSFYIVRGDKNYDKCESSKGELLSFQKDDYIVEGMIGESGISLISTKARDKNNPFKGSGIYELPKEKFRVFDDAKIKDNDVWRKHLSDIEASSRKRENAKATAREYWN